MYVFVDESGDLGFSAKASRFFVVAYVSLESPWVVRKVIKRILKRLHRRGKYTGSELKFSNSSHEVRLTVLRKLREVDWETGLIVLEKGKVKEELRRNLNVLYNYVVVHYVMRNVLFWLRPGERLTICVDRRLYRSSREAFNDYALRKAKWVWDVELGKSPPLTEGQIRVIHESSEREQCLQLADYVAGAAFQKFERGREEYYKLIENKVKAFNYLW